MKYKFHPLHLVWLGLALIAIFALKGNTFMGAAYSLTDSETNTSYGCNSTLDCYKSIVNGTITSAGPTALACSSNKCVFAECTDGETRKLNCPDGSTITIQTCNEGVWGDVVQATCPKVECDTTLDCAVSMDTDCDKELEYATTSCVNHKCTSATMVQCSNFQLFWNTSKIWVISIILILLGIGGFFLGRYLK